MKNDKSANIKLLGLFDEMINGHLQPHLLRDDDCSEIDKAIEGPELYDDEWTHYEYVFEGDDIENYATRPKSREKLNRLLKIIPFPPTEKANKYLIRIGFETRQIKEKTERFIKYSDAGEYENFALKQIAILRLLAEQLRNYVRSLGGEHIYLFHCNTSHFIAYVLKYFIVDLIRFNQRIFNLEIIPADKLRSDLFDESPEEILLYSIIPFLKKQGVEERADDYVLKAIDFNYIRLNYGLLSIGQDLFRYYLSRYGKLSRESRLQSFRKELENWLAYTAVNESIAEEIGENFNDPTINEILVPLLREEIGRLEEEEEKAGSEAGNRTFVFLSGAEKLNRLRKALKERKLIGEIGIKDFEYLFTGQPLKKRMKRLSWIGSRATAHELLRLAVYGDNQFDYRQANACMEFADHKKLDSNSRSKAQYKNEDLFRGMV